MSPSVPNERATGFSGTSSHSRPAVMIASAIRRASTASFRSATADSFPFCRQLVKSASWSRRAPNTRPPALGQRVRARCCWPWSPQTCSGVYSPCSRAVRAAHLRQFGIDAALPVVGEHVGGGLGRHGPTALQLGHSPIGEPQQGKATLGGQVIPLAHLHRHHGGDPAPCEPEHQVDVVDQGAMHRRDAIGDGGKGRAAAVAPGPDRHQIAKGSLNDLLL